MYDELVKRLRHSANIAERGLITPPSELRAAADAIEELTALSRRQEVELVKLTGELASKPRWIPVSERLPEVETYVLILFDTIAGKMQGVCFLYKDDDGNNCWTWLDRLGKNLFDIQPTHWMPLPEPPKEEAK